MALAPQQARIARLQEKFAQLSNNQKLGIMFGLALAIALSVGAWLWLTQPPEYRVLYSNLSDRDGGPVIASLQQMNIPYKMSEGGGAILVPANQVYELRLRLAGQGLPKGSVVGYELMDSQKLGTSQFGEQTNYQRALEGELTRTIQAISSIESARVHLAFPKQSVFVREQQKPSASVLVTMHAGRVLDGAQVSGIQHLISSSVADLPIKNVTIVDQGGTLLSGPPDGALQSGLNPTQLEYLRLLEQSLAKRIEDILSPIVGSENVRARVTADVDFSQSEQTAETYRPNPPDEAAIRSQQSTETSGSAGQAAAGVPGALSNQPPGAASAPVTAPAGVPASSPVGGSGGGTHKESTINYEVDKTVKVVRQAVGGVKRLTAAVVVNYRKVTAKDGKVTVKPLTPQEMTQINNLVKEAMGFNPQRGDSVNVMNASFSAAEEPSVPLWKDPEMIALAKELGRNLLIVLIVLLLFFKVFLPPLREIFSPPPPPPSLEVAEGESEEELSEAHHAKLAQNTYEENLRIAKELAKNEPRIVASVVKEWLGGS